jgi:hypothetical protein
MDGKPHEITVPALLPTPETAPSARPSPRSRITTSIPPATTHADRPPDDPLAILAEAAAELGIAESDDISLKGLADALASFAPQDER